MAQRTTPMLRQPTHHPDPALVLAFAAGALDPARALLVDTHLTFCDACRELARETEAIGGALLASEADAPLAADALARVLAQIDGAAGKEVPAAPLGRHASALMRLPDPVRDAAASALAQRRFRFAGPGLRTLALDDAGAVQLLRIEPGWGPPRHGHGGQEWTLVLTGAFRDERGRYGPGDVAHSDPALEHRPVAEPGEVCYALAVTDAPLRFKGAAGFLQRLFGA